MNTVDKFYSMKIDVILSFVNSSYAFFERVAQHLIHAYEYMYTNSSAACACCSVN